MGKAWLRQYGLVIAVGILVAVVSIVIFVVRQNGTSTAPTATHVTVTQSEPAQVVEDTKETDEFLAMWVPYFSLDMSGEKDKSEAAFQKKFDAVIQKAKESKMNTLIVQVRPFGDSFYPSRYFPWSGYLTGTQGIDPGYDPLELMITDCHDAGLEFHAWINPLRLQTNGVPKTMADSNPYLLWRGDKEKTDWCLPWESTESVYLNPGIPEVRQYIANGIQEIVENYDVDGIHFDDYFYPTKEQSFDAATYQQYKKTLATGKTPLSQAEWRKANISSLVSLVYTTIKSVKQGVVFGISPQGNVENDLAIGADVAAWCSTTGYVDYICPQLYYNFENPTLPFDRAANQWREMVSNSEMKLYFGLGVYKANSDLDEGTWKKSDDILAQQVEYGRTVGCDGFAFYSYENLKRGDAQEEFRNVMKIL